MDKAQKDILIKFIREKGRKVLTSDAIELNDKHISCKALLELLKTM